METKEVVTELKALAKALDEKSRVERMKAVGKEQYINSKIGIKKPEKKPIEKVEELIEPKVTSKIWAILGICIPTFSVFVICVDLELPVILTTVFTAGIALFLSYCFSKERKNRDKVVAQHQKRAEEINAQNAENEKYNSMYDQLVEEYEAAYKALDDEFEDNQVKLDALMNHAESEIALHGGVIAPKYYADIDEIVAILEEGRADNLKEALNVFVSDCNQKKLIEAQREMNEIAEERMRNEERHNRAMQEEARRQTDLAKQQASMAKEEAEKRKKSAPDCFFCANYPCGGKPEFCGSFRKR